ncbi:MULTISPECIES: amidophosphoribosyltransferase [Salipiger]|jgi:type IV pilus biogenesis protein PilP|uniref:Type IV pilus biogenesis protein PilP n=1 Tax=Salipiger profundus TaxID=1229727 RepID=A0A1U7DAE0_9RHOB|nr:MULTISPECIES: amidophosphoribosyltransferase [Salipiger]APX25134.1 type IV pilus biogenesis protein PilP [Salipiger profundus]SFD09961.1 type IV pilus biogenesis protein PilP [Salipiger profundus]
MSQAGTPPAVAATATKRADIPRSGPVLLGIFGRDSAPRALVRLPGGRTASVRVGDRVGNRRVVAIDETRIALARNGKGYWLDLPQVN